MKKLFSIIASFKRPIFFTLRNRKYFYDPSKNTFFFGLITPTGDEGARMMETLFYPENAKHSRLSEEERMKETIIPGTIKGAISTKINGSSDTIN